MIDRLSLTPQALAMVEDLDMVRDRQEAAAADARHRYEQAMLAEAFALAAGRTDGPPHIEHIRLLCELVARQWSRHPEAVPF